MIRIRTLALLALFLLGPGALPARAVQKPLATIRPLRGDRVAPRSFELMSLRHREPTDGLVVEVPRPRFMDEAMERQFEQMRRNPHARTPEEMGNVTIDRNVNRNAFLVRPEATPFGPVAGNGFDGISQGGYIPSEPTVAAGPLNIFSAGNSSVTITNKDGSTRVEIAGTTFFGVGAGEGGISDAQCYYDALRGRFVALCFTTGTTYSWFYLAVSKTNDARGAWWLYKFDMTKNGSTPANVWADYQSLGISDDKIAMTGQMYGLNGGSYLYQKVRVLDRAAIYAGQSTGYFDFVNWDAPTGGTYQDLFCTKAARNLTAGDNDLHLLCIPVGGSVTVTSTTIFGPPSAPIMTMPQLVPVRAFGPPLPPAQKGSTQTVPITDCRPTDFYVRDGVLSVAFHESISLGGLVSAIRFLQLRMSDNAVVHDETYAASGTWLFFPAVVTDSVGTVYLGFDRSSATEYPSSYATCMRRGESTLQSSTLLKVGVSPTLASRWGDYTGIDNDVAASGPGGSVAWYAGQYVKGTYTFGTWIQRLSITYGQIAGTVYDDCDGSAASTSDRTPLAGVTLALQQGGVTKQLAVTDANGAFNFGWLESGTYDVVVTAPSGGTAVDAATGTGGTQSRISATDLQCTITNAQTASGLSFAVTSGHPVPTLSGLSPYGRVAGSGAFTLTVNGTNFTRCASVTWDGASRTTTWVSANQLTASIPGTDIASAGTHTVRVSNPLPGGGTSNGLTFTVTNSADTQAPVVTVTSPSGGQAWAIGSAQTVTWTATDNIGVSAVDLAWSSDGGATFPNVIASGVPNTGSYPWTPASLPSSTVRVRVRAFDSGGNVGSDSSHANVSLTGWTVTASAGANGSVSPAGATGVGDGATPVVTVTPASGYRVNDVLVNGVSVGAVTSYTFSPVHANQTLAGSFAVAAYPINITINGTGSVTRNPSLTLYPAGSSVTLTAVPPAGWGFDSWSGDINSSANPVGITVNTTRNITANFTQHVYTWIGGASGDWTVATNWTPARNAPSTDDKLVFSDGGASVVSNIPTQTIGQLSLANGSTVTLQTTSPVQLTLSGRSGPDLDVPVNTTLNVTGSAALTVSIATGATGLVGGTINVANAAHRLTSTDGGSLVFVGGSKLLIGTAFSGNVFGNGSGTSFANSVVMQNGSLLAQASGSNPFGIAVPNSTVLFQAGSRYRVDGNVVIALSGRTYADFEYNYSGSLNLTGSTAYNIDSLIVSKGTLNFNMTGNGTIHGDVLVRSGATLNMNPASGTPVAMLGGALLQRLNIAGTFTNTAAAGFSVNNPSGILLRSNFTTSGAVQFVQGPVITGSGNTFAITSSGNLTGSGASTGWVVGNLRRSMATGTSTKRFDVGDFTTYTPIDLTVNGAAAAFDVTASVTSGDHPQIATSDLDPNHSVNRFWTLSRTASTAFTSYDAVLNFAAADLDAGTSVNQLVTRRYNGSAWSNGTLGTVTATSVQLPGMTAFGDLALGQVNAVDLVPPTVSLLSPNGGEVALVGGATSITWSAADNIGVTGIDLYLARDAADGTYETIATGLSNTGSYSWNPTVPYTSTAFVRIVARDAANNTAADTSNAAFAILASTGVGSDAVLDYALSPLVPNPMRSGARLSFALPQAGHVRLSVLDVQGRQVLTLADGEFAAGRHTLALGGDQANALGAGLYFARLQVAGRTFTQRFAVAR